MKGKSPETIVLRFVWLESLTQDYTNAEIGQIVRDLYHYASQSTEPQQYADRGMRGLWRSMKDGVDKDFSKYREKSQKNSDAAKARWEKQTQKDDVSAVQTDANALCEMRTHTVASNCMHLQLLAASKAKDRYQQITSISIGLHELAQTTGILVVALAQLNRNAAHAAPSTADLKESGQLEQDGDAILLLSSDGEQYKCVLAKNKEGKIGEIPLTFDKTRQRFLAVTSELERR